MRYRSRLPITLLSFGVFPLVFCTACNKVSQYSLPVIYNTTYNTNSKYFAGDDSVNVGNNTRKYTFDDGKSYMTEKNELINDLPTQTVVKQDQSVSKIYCQPSDDTGWDGEETTPSRQPNKHITNWYASNDDKLKTSETLKGITAPTGADKDFNKDYGIFTSPRNWNLATLGESNAGIGSAISSYAQAMLGFISQSGVLSRNDEGVNKILEELGWSDFTNESVKKDFYELMCDYNNVLDISNGKAKFGLSSQSFNYITSPFIVDLNNGLSPSGPFNFLDQATFGATPINLNTIYDSANNCIQSSFFGADTTTANFQSMYVGYSVPTTMSIDDKTNPLCYPTIWGAAVPVVIHPTTTQFNYYNPVKNHGINQNDYLTNDINDVKSLVSKSKSWDKIYSKHNLGKPDPKNLSYKINSSHSSTINFTPTNFTDATSQKNTADKITVRNPTLLETNTTKGYGGYIPSVHDGANWQNQVTDDSYIAFFNLAWIGFPIKDLDSQNNKSFTYKYVPYLGSLAADATTNMPAVFPARLFMNDANDGFDTNIITKSLIPAAQTLLQSNKPDAKDPIIPKDKQDAFKDNPANMCYYFDIAKLAEKQNKALKYLNARDLSINQDLPTTGDGKTALDIIRTLYNFSNDWSDFIVPSTTPY